MIADTGLEEDGEEKQSDDESKSPSPDSIEDLPMEALIGMCVWSVLFESFCYVYVCVY